MTTTLNKIYKNEEYKNMPQNTLIEVFMPLIKNLIYSYGDGIINEDIKQDLIIELLKRQELYNPELGYFPSYVSLYLRMAAKQSKQINKYLIYVHYNSMAWNAKRGKNVVANMEQIEDHTDDKSLCYTNEVKKESQEYTILKIILTQLKKSAYSKEKKIKIRNYLKAFMNGGKNSVIANKYIRELCRGTALDKMYNR